jgi:hypothetical protein
MVNDCFNGYVRACSLDIATQIKIVGEPSSVFLGLRFDCLWLPSEKYKIVSWKKKVSEDIEDLLIFFRLYFVIVGVSLYISTMYYLFL